MCENPLLLPLQALRYTAGQSFSFVLREGKWMEGWEGCKLIPPDTLTDCWVSAPDQTGKKRSWWSLASCPVCHIIHQCMSVCPFAKGTSVCLSARRDKMCLIIYMSFSFESTFAFLIDLKKYNINCFIVELYRDAFSSTELSKGKTLQNVFKCFLFSFSMEKTFKHRSSKFCYPSLKYKS